MTDTRAFFPPSSRVLLGVAVLVVTLGLTYGQWHAYNGPIETLAWENQHRYKGDSADYATIYHASRARDVIANRWHPTGYATLGLVGSLIGIGLIFSARLRRPV